MSRSKQAIYKPADRWRLVISTSRIPFRVLLSGVLVVVTACGHLLTHRVEHGDTLYSISWQYDEDFRQLAKWNKLNPPYALSPGQVIRLVPPAARQSRTLFSTGKQEFGSRDGNINNTAASAARDAKSAVREQQIFASPKIVWQWPTRGNIVVTESSGALPAKGATIIGRFDQSVVAAAPGRVVYKGNSLKRFGNLVILKHDDEWLSAYAFTNTVLVNEGDEVTGGATIATMGRNNKNESALYFEIRRDGKPVDAVALLPTQ